MFFGMFNSVRENGMLSKGSTCICLNYYFEKLNKILINKNSQQDDLHQSNANYVYMYSISRVYVFFK